MKYALKKVTENPLLSSKDDIVVEVNNELMNLTGHSKNELIGKSLTEISKMLKINSQIHLKDIENERRLYLFSKDYQAKEVTISCKKSNLSNEKKYFIKGKPSPIIEDKLPYVASLLSDNKIGVAIHSITDGILLDVNNKFLEFWDKPSYKENIIGRGIEEIIAGYKVSDFEKIFLNVIKTGKPFSSKEVKYENKEKGYSFWNISLVPVAISKIKYIIITVSDITEQVENRKLIEERNEELEAIIENMSDALVIFDKKGGYKKFNKACRDIFMFNIEKNKKYRRGV